MLDIKNLLKILSLILDMIKGPLSTIFYKAVEAETQREFREEILTATCWAYEFQKRIKEIL